MRNRLIVSKTSIIAVILFLTQFVTLPYFAWYNVLKYMSIIIMDDLSDGDLVMGAPEEDEEFDAPAHSGPILEGSRNKTLSHYAYRNLSFIVQTRIKAGRLVNGIRNIAEEIVLKELVYI